MEADYIVMKRFIKAIEFNHILEVEELLKNNKIDLNCEIWGKNVSINKYNKVDLKDSGYTALLIAAKCNSPEIIKIILKYKYININKRANDEYTALMIACKYNHIEVVKELLKHPYINIAKFAYVNMNLSFHELKKRGYSDCETAFSIAVNKNNIEIVELLAKHPGINKGEETALMWSARKNRIDIIKIILENNPKIDINKKNRMCKSAVDLGTIEIKNILKLHEFKMKNSDLLKELNIEWSDIERIVKVNSLWEENHKNIEILINEKINEL